MQKSTIILAAGLAAAVAFALIWGSPAQPPAPQSVATDPTEPNEPNAPNANADMPPDHPAVDNASAFAPPTTEPAALTWKAPAKWTKVPNPNAMRLATYKISDDTELVVTRAGGDLQSNIERWKGQFEGEAVVQQSQKKVHDLRVTIVKIEGTYGGGMDPSAAPHEGWTMLAAIVETPEQPYFFKIVGPSATVTAAEKPFDEMIEALAPT
ncbi:MAG TPA: hypothetical protein VGH28_16685 [Polyangiaceae bacterium]|jgi:hypothetical protein